jgi:hypothetical protein
MADGVVAALAGRRIDAEDAEVCRFPLRNAARVKKLLVELLRDEHITLLVSSAACGADLTALAAAAEAGVRCRIVLPFDAARFRNTSVSDRPGEWGAIFDRIFGEVRRCGDLVVLGGHDNDDQAYANATEYIIDNASSASKTTPIAIVVWEGHPRPEGDATAEFRDGACRAGFTMRTVLTLDDAA